MLAEVPETRNGGPPEAALWRFVRRRGFAVFQTHGYREVRPSVLEPVGLAERSGPSDPAFPIGADAELRSDPAASLARLFVQRARPDESFVRWMLAGPVFDSAPRGSLRWRVWQSLSGLVIGATDPAADAEVAVLALSLAGDLGLRDPKVAIGTLGERGDIEGYVSTLSELLPLRCADCRAAPDTLRFLTCDDEGCRALCAAAPPVRDFLGVASLKHHEAVLATLEASGFHAHDEPRLAFGLGRYQRTLIEVRARTPDGAQVVVARGGRRDGLIATLGGRELPAVALTLGVARAAACVSGEGESYEPSLEVFFASRGAGARAWALRAAAVGRALGFRTDVELRDVPWEAQVARAEELHARVVVLAGEAERKKGEVAVRDMRMKEFRRVPEGTLVKELKRILR